MSNGYIRVWYYDLLKCWCYEHNGKDREFDGKHLVMEINYIFHGVIHTKVVESRRFYVGQNKIGYFEADSKEIAWIEEKITSYRISVEED